MASQAEESIASGEAQPTADAKSAVGNCIAKIPGHSASGSTGSSESCDVNSNKKSNRTASADSNVSQTLSAPGDRTADSQCQMKDHPQDNDSVGSGVSAEPQTEVKNSAEQTSNKESENAPLSHDTVAVVSASADSTESPRGSTSVTSTKDQSSTCNSGDGVVAVSQTDDNKEIEGPEGDLAADATKEKVERNPNDPREKIFEPWPSTSQSGKPKGGLPATKSHSTESPPHPHPLPPPVSGGTRLQILPRTTQYEPHPLLQKEGLSELEVLLAQRAKEKEEKELTSKSNPNLGNSKEDPGASAGRRPIARNKVRSQSLKLVPRSAHYERNALLDKRGGDVCELEKFLREKEREVILKRSKTLDEEPVKMKSGDKAGYAPRPLKLEPRTNQYEKHALLEDKDESTGLSILDIFLQEKEDEIADDKGKCSTKCTCKNAHCPNCKGESPRPSTTDSEGIEPRGDQVRSSSKRVTFQSQEEKDRSASDGGDGKKESGNKGSRAGSDKKKSKTNDSAGDDSARGGDGDAHAQGQEGGQTKGAAQRKGQKGKKSCTIS